MKKKSNLGAGKRARQPCKTLKHKAFLIKTIWALPGWLSSLEPQPVHQGFVSSIPGQGTYLGAHVGGSQLMFLSHIDVTPLSLPVSKINKYNISSSEDQKIGIDKLIYANGMEYKIHKKTYV